MTVNPLDDRLAGSVSYYLTDELGDTRHTRQEDGPVIIVISADGSLRSDVSPAEIKLSGGAQ